MPSRALFLLLLSLGAALCGCASAPAPRLSFAELYARPEAPGAGLPPAQPRPAPPAALRSAAAPGASVHSSGALTPAGLPVVALRPPLVPPVALSLRPLGPSLRPPAASAASAAPPSRLVLDWPVEPVAVTSSFGRRPHPVTGKLRRHLGLDLAASEGQVVSTAGAGRVVRAGWRGGYGLQVEVVHEGGVHTRYGHLSRVLVKKGTLLEPGDIVGLAGNTGRSTGPHLHFELWREGRALDPLPVLVPRALGLQTREGRRPHGRRPR